MGNGPSGVAVGAGAVWAANRNDGTVSRIDPDTEVTETRAGRARAARHRGRPDGVWVANAGDGTVMRIDPRSRQVTDTIDVESSPAALAVVDGTCGPPRSRPPSTHRGGTLRVSISDVPATRFPLDSGAVGVTAPTVTRLRRPGRLPASRRLGGQRRSSADLATRRCRSPAPDGRTYRFRLRPDLRFSNGAPVTPEDVRASLERLLAVTGATR